MGIRISKAISNMQARRRRVPAILAKTTTMNWRGLMLMVLLPLAAFAAERRLPPLHDGSVVSGPGQYRQEGKLELQGRIALRNLTLELRGPITLAAGTTLRLENVHLLVSDPPGTANGTSNLRCQGPAHVIIRDSTMAPSGGAHPIWVLTGKLEVDKFQTQNSEFHLEHATASLQRLKIFELEISNSSQVTAQHLDLVFLSTHSGNDDRLQFSDIPADKRFSRRMTLGSGAKADLSDVRLQLFLVYIHGSARARLSRVGRVQLAIFPQCKGSLRLPRGRVGSAAAPVVFPQPGATDCPFQITLDDVNVDTWDVYASGQAELTFSDSVIDEMTANEQARLTARDSEVYADWLAAAGHGQLRIERSTVGAMRLAKERPDLATSQVRLTGDSWAVFSQVRFDCGIVASDRAKAEIVGAVTSPLYVHTSGEAVVRTMRQAAAATP